MISDSVEDTDFGVMRTFSMIDAVISLCIFRFDPSLNKIWIKSTFTKIHLREVFFSPNVSFSVFVFVFFLIGTGDVLMIPPLDFSWPVSWKHLSTFIQEELSIVT